MRGRSLWWWVVMLATIFAMGTSGSWLGIQTANAMGKNWGWFGWAWGMFGAAVAGIALYGGVNLIARGNNRGYMAIFVTGLALIAMDIRFFDGHGDTAYILGAFPTALAFVAGIVETQHSKHEEQQQKDTADEQRRHQIEDEDRRHKREMDRLRLELEMAARQAQQVVAPPATGTATDAATAAPQVSGGATAEDGRSTGTKFDLACALLTETGGEIANDDLSHRCNISPATARTYRSRWEMRNSERVTETEPVVANGNGHAH